MEPDAEFVTRLPGFLSTGILAISDRIIQPQFTEQVMRAIAANPGRWDKEEDPPSPARSPPEGIAAATATPPYLAGSNRTRSRSTPGHRRIRRLRHQPAAEGHPARTTSPCQAAQIQPGSGGNARPGIPRQRGYAPGGAPSGLRRSGEPSSRRHPSPAATLDHGICSGSPTISTTTARKPFGNPCGLFPLLQGEHCNPRSLFRRRSLGQIQKSFSLPDALAEHITYTSTRLSAHPLTATLASGFTSLQKTWVQVNTQEIHLWVDILKATAMVSACDDDLDILVDKVAGAVLTVTGNDRSAPLFKLAQFITFHAVVWGKLAAASVLTALPIVGVVLLVQGQMMRWLLRVTRSQGAPPSR